MWRKGFMEELPLLKLFLDVCTLSRENGLNTMEATTLVNRARLIDILGHWLPLDYTITLLFILPKMAVMFILSNRFKIQPYYNYIHIDFYYFCMAYDSEFLLICVIYWFYYRHKSKYKIIFKMYAFTNR